MWQSAHPDVQTSLELISFSIVNQRVIDFSYLAENAKKLRQPSSDSTQIVHLTYYAFF